jgi:hypothetical protein
MQSLLSRCASSMTTSRRGPDSRSVSALMSWNRLRLRGGAAPVSVVSSASATSRIVGLAGNASVHTFTFPAELAGPGAATSRSRSSAASTA